MSTRVRFQLTLGGTHYAGWMVKNVLIRTAAVKAITIPKGLTSWAGLMYIYDQLPGSKSITVTREPRFVSPSRSRYIQWCQDKYLGSRIPRGDKKKKLTFAETLRRDNAAPRQVPRPTGGRLRSPQGNIPVGVPRRRNETRPVGGGQNRGATARPPQTIPQNFIYNPPNTGAPVFDSFLANLRAARDTGIAFPTPFSAPEPEPEFDRRGDLDFFDDIG